MTARPPTITILKIREIEFLPDRRELTKPNTASMRRVVATATGIALAIGKKKYGETTINPAMA